MARTQVGGIRSVGQRVEAESGAVPDLKAPGKHKYAFQSKFPGYRLSLKKRIVRTTLEGERFEDPILSKAGSPLDWVVFENGYFGTNDPEVAHEMQAKRGYGLGLDFWLVSEQLAAQDTAAVAEMRRRLAERPDLAKRVLAPSDAEDFELPAGRP